MASYYNTPPVQRGAIYLRLPVDEPPPEMVPYELRRYISTEAWQARLRAVLRKGSRYCKPAFDTIWAIITFILTLAAPIAIYFVMLDVLPHPQEVVFDFWPYGWTDESRYWKARLIALGVFFGVVLLSVVPMLLWKLSGKSSVNKMLQKFEAEDRAVRDPDTQIPTYRIRMPGIGHSALNLKITMPPAPMTNTTSFQPGSQPAPFVVNPPTDPSAAAYPYYTQPGQAQLNVPLDGVPLYNNFDEKIPDYSGPTIHYVPIDTKGSATFEEGRV
ncbi:hypothetical protein BKA93DRAFT_245782 [Sparassis latifolia]|uniref:Uncharacterized protein n=1 Tax=Sparassis crispa TaxID=139825 RepID=A0A401GFM1_9APHY|nr:predicted protein [Sparassis crispa]GBE80994.1 predicted protein [Sparassis crispa]